MALFLLVRTPNALNNDALGATIAKKYPSDHLKLEQGQWLIWSEKNIKDLSQEIGIEAGKHYNGTFVALVSDYFGLHNKSVWDWIKERQP